MHALRQSICKQHLKDVYIYNSQKLKRDELRIIRTEMRNKRSEILSPYKRSTDFKTEIHLLHHKHPTKPLIINRYKLF